MSGHGPGVPLALAHTADGRPILCLADLTSYDPRPRRYGGHDRYYCPVHGSDNQRSLALDPRSGRYHCYACRAAGTLRDFWPDRVPDVSDAPSASNTLPPPPAPPAPRLSVLEIGRSALERQARYDAARVERLAGPAPHGAAAFLARRETMSAALRDPACEGAAYLRGRGLDPLLAADLGAGYATPNSWPGDRGRRVGRIVYPLADAATGRVVSALGRLCLDPTDSWSGEARALFTTLKQRKLAGCPAGVWPFASIERARTRQRPIVLVEGPADVLALLQGAGQRLDLDAVALIGTANVVPAAALRALPGIVVALDEDDAGARAARALRDEFMLAGVSSVAVETLPPGWLGGATDPGDLAARVTRAAGEDDRGAARHAYERAVETVVAICSRLRVATWDDERAATLLAGLFERCAQACRDVAIVWPPLPPEADGALDAACAAKDWPALLTAVDGAEQAYLAALAAHHP